MQNLTKPLPGLFSEATACVSFSNTSISLESRLRSPDALASRSHVTVCRKGVCTHDQGSSSGLPPGPALPIPPGVFRERNRPSPPGTGRTSGDIPPGLSERLIRSSRDARAEEESHRNPPLGCRSATAREVRREERSGGRAPPTWAGSLGPVAWRIPTSMGFTARNGEILWTIGHS
jgi:hypothetical protein